MNTPSTICERLEKLAARITKFAGINSPKTHLGWAHEICTILAEYAALPPPSPVARDGCMSFDMLAHLQRQREWSERTFGPGQRTAGVVDHIRSELLEIEAEPDGITEWVDVIILALDGMWRAGATPEQIVSAISDKQAINENRVWPDWRTVDTTKSIEHVK